MRMQKRQFRIGELAKHLNVKKFVIRFWEKEFALHAVRSGGGQRFYNEDDINSFCIIKSLLYEQGFTIAGARKHLQDTSLSSKSAQKSISDTSIPKDIIQKLVELKQQLLIVREHLQ